MEQLIKQVRTPLSQAQASKQVSSALVDHAPLQRAPVESNGALLTSKRSSGALQKMYGKAKSPICTCPDISLHQVS